VMTWSPAALQWAAAALLAQLVEHFHGKEGVVGSSPTEGLPHLRGIHDRRDAHHVATHDSASTNRTLPILLVLIVRPVTHSVRY
jgi:hypothetical protein